MIRDFQKDIKEKLGLIRREAEERDAKRRALSLGYAYTDLSTWPINVDAISLISEEKARAAKMAAIEAKGKKVVLIALNPGDPMAKEIIAGLESKNYKPAVYVVSLSNLNYVLGYYKFVFKEQNKISGEIKIEESKLAELKKSLTSLEAIGVKLEELKNAEDYTGQVLEVIMAGALANRASDIHLEPRDAAVKLRLRIDGLLHDVSEDIEKTSYLYILSRIKLLSGMKINVHDKPQDGRFTIKLQAGNVEIRVVVASSEFGEAVVMRLLDSRAISLSLSDLGLREDDLEIIKGELRKPNGMILNTGPTGSGKTTTLYAFLKHKNNPEVKIITIEDPIEYNLEGIEQTQVNKDVGYTFANGLSSIMRQDPDVILVGEIRDKETAEISIQAALTGHLVFSTIHTNNAAGAIPRLLDLGVRPSSIGPALNVVISQRLIRRLCDYCKVPDEIGSDLKKKIENYLNKIPKRVSRAPYKEIKIFKNKGCDKCNGFGYRGRIGIFEFLLVGPDMEELINQQSSEVKIQEFALKQNMVTIQQDGFLKIISGLTTFDEVETLTGPIEWY